jgi:hypothetical protein
MKMCVVSPYENNYICPVVNSLILSKLPNLVPSQEQADVIILPIFVNNLKIKKSILTSKKPYVIMDFIEYGVAWDPKTMPTHIIGGNNTNFKYMDSDEWHALESYIQSNPPKIYFKRELKLEDQSDKILPIEYPCGHHIKNVQTKDEFNKRKIDVFFCWGLSHKSRPHLHGEIYKQSYEKGINVLSSWETWNQTFLSDVEKTSTKKVWAPIHTHHSVRAPINKIIEWNERSKISVSLYGCGRKCFRHAECVGTIMAKQDDGLSWAHPWKHGENCILLREDFLFDDLYSATLRDDLYEIYVACNENMRHYLSKNYIDNHIIYQIKKSL